MSSPDVFEREAATGALKKIGPLGTLALKRALTAPDNPETTYAVIEWVTENHEELGSTKGELEAPLLEMLKSSPSLGYRTAAFAALVRMSLTKKFMTDYDIHSLRNKIDLTRHDGQLAWLSWLATDRYDDPKTVEVIVDALTSSTSVAIRARAAELLSNLAVRASTDRTILASIKEQLGRFADLVIEKEQYLLVRQYLAHVISLLGSDATPALHVILTAAEAKDPDPDVLGHVAASLMAISDTSEASVRALERLVQSDRPDVKYFAARGIESRITQGLVGRQLESILSVVANVLPTEQDAGIRVLLVQGLKRIDFPYHEHWVKVASILAAARRNTENSEMNGLVSSILSRIQQSTLPKHLEELIGEFKKAHGKVKDTLGVMLAGSAEGIAERAEDLSPDELKVAKIQITDATEILPDPLKAQAKGALSNITDAQLSNIVRAVLDNRWAEIGASAVAVYCGLVAIWTLMLVFFPLGLLWLHSIIAPLSVSIPKLENKLSLADVSLLSMFAYRPRVLDKWVASQIEEARQRFRQRRTVADRAVHVPSPTLVSGELVAGVEPGSLRGIFAKGQQKRSCLLIWGEGGVGKTSLACTIARWAMHDAPEQRICGHLMLPVLIDQEFDVVSDGGDCFRREVHAELRNVISSPDVVEPKLFTRLLHEKRILVIVDHFSELAEDVQDAIVDGMNSSPANAVIVTSRDEGTMNAVVSHELRPLKIEGNRLASFMDAYLASRGVRDWFDDPEYFAICGKLSRMVGQRQLPVLLAKLYAEEMIRAKEEATATDAPPESIPDLMRRYINQVNSASTNTFSNTTVQNDMMSVSWQCLRATFRPQPADRKAVLKRLEKHSPGTVDHEARLRHLTETLKLVEVVGASESAVRVTLDPLAEYLAALSRLPHIASWATEIASINRQSGGKGAQGYVLALWDCCVAAGDGEIEDEQLEMLGNLAGLSPEDIDRAMRQRIVARIRAAVENLQAPDGGLRETSAVALKEIVAAREKPALEVLRAFAPNLVVALRDAYPGVREVCARLLGQLGPAAADASAALSELLKQEEDARVIHAAEQAVKSIRAPTLQSTVAIRAR